MALFLITCVSFVMCLLLRNLNRLHIYDLLACWIVLANLNQDIAGVFTLNLQYLQIDRNNFTMLTVYLYRLFLTPLVILVGINFLLRSKSRWTRAVTFLAAVALLTCIEYGMNWFDVATHLQWKLWWSILEWSLLILIALATWKWMKWIRREGV